MQNRERLEDYLDDVLRTKLARVQTAHTQALCKVHETKNLIQYLNHAAAPARHLLDLGAETFVEAEVDSFDVLNVELTNGFYVQLPRAQAIEFLGKRLDIYKAREQLLLERVAHAKTEIKCFLEALGALQENPLLAQLIKSDHS